MAAIGTGVLTLLDRIKRQAPDGSVAMIVEALTQTNPILMDAHAQEGNLDTGERVTIRSGLPAVGYRLINQGVARSKSRTVQVDETCALLEGRSDIDIELARLGGNEARFRASEDTGFLQSMNNQAATTLFYGSTKTAPEEFHGFTPRYKALTGDNNSSHVLDAGLSPAGADQASIWFITWGPQTAYMIYPKGTQAGIESKDLGMDYVDDGTGAEYLAWRTHYIWRLGLCIKDWRYHVRIANVDTSAVTASGTELIDAMVAAYNRVKDLNSGRTIIYMNRTVLTSLDQQIINKPNVWFSPVEWHGRKVTGFRGLPIVHCDALDITESVVT